MTDNNPFNLETKLSGALLGNYGAVEVDFNTKFPTWIIGYCPDTNSWFCTNKRFFYYEYPTEFPDEDSAVEYFKAHVQKFIELNREMHPSRTCGAFLENTMVEYGKED